MKTIRPCRLSWKAKKSPRTKHSKVTTYRTASPSLPDIRSVRSNSEFLHVIDMVDRDSELNPYLPPRVSCSLSPQSRRKMPLWLVIVMFCTCVLLSDKCIKDLVFSISERDILHICLAILGLVIPALGFYVIYSQVRS
jgi:hypothetical protein